MALASLVFVIAAAAQLPPAPSLPALEPAPSWMDRLIPAAAAAPPPAHYLRAVFYATDADSGIESFRAHADEISLVAPQCFALDRHGVLHGSVPDDLMAIARAHHVGVMPLVINNGFSRHEAHDFLHDALARDRAVGSLLETARDDDLAGFQVDFEGLLWTDRDAFSRFIEELAAGLHRHGKILSVAVAARTSEDLTDNFKTYSGVYDYARLAGAADFLSVMAYPEHSGGDPGPLASYPWVEQVIRHELQYIPPDKFSLGVPTYQTDWTERRVRISIWRRIGRRLRRYFRWTYHLFGRTQPASTANTDDLRWDPVLRSSYRVYGNRRHYHVVWIEDARSFAAKLALARAYHLRGFSVWRLGLEDAGIWAQLPAPVAPEAVLVETAAPAAAQPAIGPVPIGASGYAAARAHAPAAPALHRRVTHRRIARSRTRPRTRVARRRAPHGSGHVPRRRTTASRRTATARREARTAKHKPATGKKAREASGDSGH